jgi:hypothetical protein
VLTNYVSQPTTSQPNNATNYNFPVYPTIIDPAQAAPAATPTTQPTTPAPVVPTDQNDDDGPPAPADKLLLVEGCDAYFAGGHWQSILRGSAPIVITQDIEPVWDSVKALAGVAIVFGTYGGFISAEELEEEARRQARSR